MFPNDYSIKLTQLPSKHGICPKLGALAKYFQFISINNSIANWNCLYEGIKWRAHYLIQHKLSQICTLIPYKIDLSSLIPYKIDCSSPTFKGSTLILPKLIGSTLVLLYTVESTVALLSPRDRLSSPETHRIDLSCPIHCRIDSSSLTFKGSILTLPKSIGSTMALLYFQTKKGDGHTKKASLTLKYSSRNSSKHCNMPQTRDIDKVCQISFNE